MFVGGLDPAYVLDRMDPYEIEACMEGIHKRHMESWNQTRQIVYTVAQVNSRRPIDIREMMPFPWDRDTFDEAAVSEAERDRLRKEMDKFIKGKRDG